MHWPPVGSTTPCAATHLLSLFAPDFYDNVSGRGLDILDVVAQWYDTSFADRSAELHEVLSSEDRVMVWYTFRGRRIGNGFPRLHGRRIEGRPVAWDQVHIFRVRRVGCRALGRA
ncbi:nuclear transport factor 2 family protein [Nocardia sp. NBC_01009]|uniref:nuclear transport factor 2 family protein n=1 Tax=Nocardia sp. NBC_01009 TaxID=2975996 RepID=UPI00386AE4AC